MNKSKRLKILIIVFLALLLVLVLVFFMKGSKTKTLIAPENVISSDQKEGRELLGLLLNLKSIKLNTDIFSNKSFQTLEDFGIELLDEPVGRSNPFLPLDSNEVTSNQNIDNNQ